MTNDLASETTKIDAQDEFGRGVSPIAGINGHSLGARALGLAVLAVGGAFLVLIAFRPHAKPAREQDLTPARQIVRFEAAQPLEAQGKAAPPQLERAAPLPRVPALAPSPADRVPSIRHAQTNPQAPIIAFSAQMRQSAVALDPATQGAEPGEQPSDALSARLQTSDIKSATARRLGDRNFLLLAGATIPCALQTALNSETPGLASCLVLKDIYSDNGQVVLIDKGSKVLGQYAAGLSRGQRRLFIVWTRLVTPLGVAVDLASPASDALGRAGVGGHVDTRFADRFGAALVFTILDDGAAAAASSGADRSLVRLPSQAGSIALEQSSAITPSLTAPQGLEVSIFLARDLDFSSVYELRAR